MALALALSFLRGRTGTRLNRFFSSTTAFATFLSSLLLLLVLAGTNGADIELRNKISGLDSHVIVRRTQLYEVVCGYEDISGRLRALPSVVAVSPYVWSDIQFESEGRIIAPATIKGVLPQFETSATDINAYLASHNLVGALTASGPSMPVVLGSRLASRLGAKIGQSITIMKPGFSTRFFPGFVAATFDSGTQHDSELAYTTLEAAQNIRGVEPGCVNALAVRTADPMTSAPVAAKIAGVLGREFHAADWSTLYPQFRDMIVLLRRWILLLNMVLLFFSVMFSAGAVLLVIYQRRRELALLLTMGMKPSAVRMAVAFVGTLLGLLGTIVALSLGPLMCRLMTVHRVVSLPGSQANISYIPFIPRTLHFVMIATLQIVVPTLLGWWVAGDLSSIELIEVLRDE